MVIFSENPRISFPVNMSPKVYIIHCTANKLYSVNCKISLLYNFSSVQFLYCTVLYCTVLYCTISVAHYTYASDDNRGNSNYLYYRSTLTDKRTFKQ